MPPARDVLGREKEPTTCFLARHATGEWGELDPADFAENEHSIIHRFRLLSSRPTDTGEKLWLVHLSRPVYNRAAVAAGALTGCRGRILGRRISRANYYSSPAFGGFFVGPICASILNGSPILGQFWPVFTRPKLDTDRGERAEWETRQAHIGYSHR